MLSFFDFRVKAALEQTKDFTRQHTIKTRFVNYFFFVGFNQTDRVEVFTVYLVLLIIIIEFPLFQLLNNFVVFYYNVLLLFIHGLHIVVKLYIFLHFSHLVHFLLEIVSHFSLLFKLFLLLLVLNEDSIWLLAVYYFSLRLHQVLTPSLFLSRSRPGIDYWRICLLVEWFKHSHLKYGLVPVFDALYQLTFMLLFLVLFVQFFQVIHFLSFFLQC